MKLTEKIIEKLDCPAGKKDRIVFDDTVRGLGVRVSANGRKNFLVQFQTEHGAKRRLPLGQWGSLTLEQARLAARAKLGAVAIGNDPAADRKTHRAVAKANAEAEQYTLRALLKDWLEIGLVDRRESYRKEAIRAVSYAFRDRLHQRADALSKAEVVQILDSLVRSGRRAIAGRTMAYARACYSWAVKRGRLASNPFAVLPLPSTTISRDRVLSDREVRVIYQASGRLGFPFGPLFQILLLTAQRRDEVSGMRWDEISKDLTTWTIPAHRAKNGKAHIVHLAPQTREIIDGIPRHEGNRWLFSTSNHSPVSGFSKAKKRLDTLAKEENQGEPLENWRLHDFRRSCVTWLAGAGFNPAVADKLLNHSTTTGLTTVGNVYQRAEYLPERRKALEAWAQHVVLTTAGIPLDNVIYLE